MLVHVNKRVKGNNNVLLPMDALLVQYQVWNFGKSLKSGGFDHKKTVLGSATANWRELHVSAQ